MGLPSDIIEVFMLAFASRAAAAGLILKMVNNGSLSFTQSIIAVVVTTTFFPCFPNVIAIARRMGVMIAAAMSAMVCASSLILAGGLRWILVLAFGH
jgi:ferrous iron transport protein B